MAPTSRQTAEHLDRRLELGSLRLGTCGAPGANRHSPTCARCSGGQRAHVAPECSFSATRRRRQGSVRVSMACTSGPVPWTRASARRPDALEGTRPSNACLRGGSRRVLRASGCSLDALRTRVSSATPVFRVSTDESRQWFLYTRVPLCRCPPADLIVSVLFRQNAQQPSPERSPPATHPQRAWPASARAHASSARRIPAGASRQALAGQG